MLNNKTVAVVVPAYNEGTQISIVIETMPDFVDRIIVVNDCSKDDTSSIVKEHIKNDHGNYYNEKIGQKKVEKNRYNEAEIVLEQNNITELNYYIPHEIVNENLSDTYGNIDKAF